jgi:hypothetical protein
VARPVARAPVVWSVLMFWFRKKWPAKCVGCCVKGSQIIAEGGMSQIIHGPYIDWTIL